MKKFYLYSKHIKDRIFRDVAIVTSGETLLEECIFINCDSTNHVSSETVLKNCLGLNTEMSVFINQLMKTRQKADMKVAEEKEEAVNHSVKEMLGYLLSTYGEIMSDQMYLAISNIRKRYAMLEPELYFEWLRDEREGWNVWWVYLVKCAGKEFEVKFKNPRRDHDEEAVWAAHDEIVINGWTEAEAEEKGEPYHVDFWLEEINEQIYKDLER